MITVREIPHRGPARQWECADREAFCLAIMAANPRSEWDPEWGFDRFRQYLASDLRSLWIEED